MNVRVALLLIVLAAFSACDCHSTDSSGGDSATADDDSISDDDTSADDDVADDDADDDAGTTTTTVVTTTTTAPTGSTTTTAVTTTSTTTSTQPGEGTACNPFVEDPEVIDREQPFGPWPEFEERGITFRQIISTGAGEGRNDILITSDGLIRVLAEDGRSLDVIAVGPAGEVSREVVDPRGGEWKVLGKDADDHLYVLYTVYISQYTSDWEVRAATNKSGEWVRTVLFTSRDDENMSLDMAVDASGLMHIAYSGRNNSPAAYYATWDGETYAETQIIADDDNWRYVYTIALDSSGSPHMLVSDPDGAWHWRLTDDAWTGDLVSDNAFAWDLEIDASDVMHAGFAANGGHLVYGKYENGTWSFEDLDDCQGGVRFITVNVDSDGHVHISYTNGNEDDVLYATNASGTWVHTFLFEEVVGSDEGHAWDMASALDAAGKIHVVHRRYNNYHYSRDSDLNLTTNASGEWVRRRLIYGRPWSWDFPPAVYDSSGRMHVAFVRSRFTVLDYTLFYGVLDGDTWTEEVVEGPDVCDGEVGSPVLQMDSAENVYILYYCEFSSGSEVKKMGIIYLTPVASCARMAADTRGVTRGRNHDQHVPAFPDVPNAGSGTGLLGEAPMAQRPDLPRVPRRGPDHAPQRRLLSVQRL